MCACLCVLSAGHDIQLAEVAFLLSPFGFLNGTQFIRHGGKCQEMLSYIFYIQDCCLFSCISLYQSVMRLVSSLIGE